MKEQAVALYGINPVREALLSEGNRPDKIYLLSGRGGKAVDEILILAKRKKISILISDRTTLTRIAGTDKHQGVVAFVSSGAYHDLETLLERGREGKRLPFLFLIDGVEDPRNLGAIIRTVDAAGGDGLVIPTRRAAGLSATVAKTSAGALSHLPVARVVNLSRAIERFKQEGIWVLGLDAAAEKPYDQYDFRAPVAIVVGGEGKGIRRKTLEACDETLSLPMHGHVGSLNVSVALGIVAYEVLRQRQKQPF